MNSFRYLSVISQRIPRSNMFISGNYNLVRKSSTFTSNVRGRFSQTREKFVNYLPFTLLNNRVSVIENQRRCLATEGKREVSSFNVQDYDDFKERVLNSSKPVVVDFHADWCGPCKMLGPRLEMVVDNRKGKVMLAKVNVDDCADLAMDYGVRSVPTVIGFRQGQPVDQFVGLQEEEQINAFVNKLEKAD